jgi:glycosyltransferase involved in cell wall biosynthesis
MKDKITIIIPCKNEEKYIDGILNDLYNQIGIEGVKIIIADSKSTDNTVNIINSYKNKLNIQIIDGGLPSIGRNRGANISTTEYLLFIDSDARIYDRYMISKSYSKMVKHDLDLLTSKLNSHYFIVKILYKINNLLIWLSKFDKPFAVGMYMMIKKSKFDEIGGFPEDVAHCEDYLLSKRISTNKFGIIRCDVYSDNRRFKKIGYWGMIKYVFKNIVNRNSYNYFKKNINYWE